MAELTLEDIAEKAGVSRSTVSRVINKKPNVKDSVRNRVLEVIQSTGYHPNLAARSLASQRSWMIGLVLPQSVSIFFTDPYFHHLTNGIAQACNRSNYTLGLFLVSSEEDEEKIFPRVSRRGLLDGAIVQAGHHGDTMIGRLADSSIPLVFAGRPFHSEDINYIDIDNVKAASTAVSHLLQLGYQRVATITGPASSTVGIDRKQGYLKALAASSRELDAALIAEGNFTEESGYLAMQRLLPAKPDAVFAASDIMALGAMRAVREVNLSIPDDIAFVGFDDLPFAATPVPPLTTVRQPISEFGASAVEFLIEQIENGVNQPRHIIKDTELIIRESCGASRR